MKRRKSIPDRLEENPIMESVIHNQCQSLEQHKFERLVQNNHRPRSMARRRRSGAKYYADARRLMIAATTVGRKNVMSRAGTPRREVRAYSMGSGRRSMTNLWWVLDQRPKNQGNQMPPLHRNMVPLYAVMPTCESRERWSPRTSHGILSIDDAEHS